MSERPFDAVRQVLHDISQKPLDQSTTLQLQTTRLDPNRQARTGIPEIIYGKSKTADDVVRSLAELARRNGRAMATRCPKTTLVAVQSSLSNDFDVAITEE